MGVRRISKYGNIQRLIMAIDIVMPISEKVNVSIDKMNGINVNKTLIIKPKTQVTASDILDKSFLPSSARFSTNFSVLSNNLYCVGEAPSIATILSSIQSVLRHNPNGFLGFFIDPCCVGQLCENLIESGLIRLLS